MITGMEMKQITTDVIIAGTTLIKKSEYIRYPPAENKKLTISYSSTTTL